MAASNEGSAAWRERDRAVLWHPFTQHNLWDKEDFPVIVAGEGVYLFDADGKKYIDGVSSLWLNVHGHRRKEIDDAVKAQLDRISHSTYLGQSHPPGIELAERLVDISPRGLTRVFFSDDGSTAMEIAIKMAYQYWRQVDPPRHEAAFFVKLSNAYHGDTIGSVSVGGMDLFHATYRDLLFRTAVAPAPYCYRCPLPDRAGECRNGSGCTGALEEILAEKQERVAAVVIEPVVQGAAGMVTQPGGYVKAVRDLCDKHDVLMVADEVAAGFGRTGHMFACDGEGVTPDLMAVGKGLSGGYLPIAATMATEKVFDAFRGETHSTNTFFHGHSYTANQLACAASLASLDLFEKNKIVDNVRKRARTAGAWLEKISALESVGQTRRAGLMMGIELVQDKKTRAPYDASLMMGRKVILAAREKGLIIRPLGDVVIIMPPLCVSDEELDKIMSVTLDSIAEVT